MSIPRTPPFQVVLQKVKHLRETTVYIELADACLEGETGNSQVLGKKQNWTRNALNLQAKAETGQKGGLEATENRRGMLTCKRS